MAFSEEDVRTLLVACHRRCCVCHRFCGSKIELDHIVQKADGGPDTADNAIPLCFECHAEAHAYNDRHPRGRKFRPDELRAHKEQWLQICRSRPEVFVGPARSAEVGPIQALVDELDFNLVLAREIGQTPSRFHDEQFRRAIGAGAIAVLDDALKSQILHCYRLIGEANGAIDRANLDLGATKQLVAPGKTAPFYGLAIAQHAKQLIERIERTRETLLRFLGRQD